MEVAEEEEASGEKAHRMPSNSRTEDSTCAG